jgi:16S rRNA (uracil1498-N3)-methyltransferase
MTRRRWIADEVRADEVHGDTAALIGEHASHLSRVLRAEIGQEFDIATGAAVRQGKIISVSDDRVEFQLGGEVSWKPSPKLTLALAIFKFDRMEWAIEKCTEIGVDCIVPVIARRTDAHLARAAAKRRERWQRLSRQAAEQSRRAKVPEIAAPIELKELASRTNAMEAARIVLAETLASANHAPRLREILDPGLSELTLAVGPEGGWAPEELAWFREAEWLAASLGDTILRAETAAIVAVSLAIDAWAPIHNRL